MHWIPILWDLLCWLFARPELKIPFHIAIIPNGNRRWARWMRVSLEDSYISGARRALELLEWAREADIKHVTFFGLSCENLGKRTEEELDALIKGALLFLRTALARGYKVHVFGNIEQFRDSPKYKELFGLLEQLQSIEHSQDDFVVHVAANYSGKLDHENEPLLDALWNRGFVEVLEKGLDKYVRSAGVPPVDLVIRTGAWRESRLSGLLPFQTAYAELYFVCVYWSGFRKRHFQRALRWYSWRNRNFGK